MVKAVRAGGVEIAEIEIDGGKITIKASPTSAHDPAESIEGLL